MHLESIERPPILPEMFIPKVQQSPPAQRREREENGIYSAYRCRKEGHLHGAEQ